MSFIGDLFGGGSKSTPQPATVQTVSQTSEFPSEVKPFITDVLEKAKAQQEGREFELFEGPRIAPFSDEEQAAFTGTQQLADAGLSSYPGLASSAFYAQQAQDAAEQGIKQFGEADAERLMNPFQQQVIDIEKDELRRQFEGTTLPQIAAQAAGAGSYGGSRQAILEAEAQRNLQQQLGDVQARGLRDAYDVAARQFEAERARQAQGAGQFAGFAQQFPSQAFRELGAVQAIGEQKKDREQRALDIALSDFLTEQEFPTRQLQEYQSLIRGFPMSPNVFKQNVTSIPSVPLSQQLLGLTAAGAGLAGQFGAFRKSGGQIKGGLSSLETHQNNVPRPQSRPKVLGDMSVKDMVFAIRGGEFPSTLIEQADRYLETIPGFEDERSRTSVAKASAIRDMLKADQLDPNQRIAQDKVDTSEAIPPPAAAIPPPAAAILPTTSGGTASGTDSHTTRPKAKSSGRRDVVVAQRGNEGNFTGLLEAQATEHQNILKQLRDAQKDYLTESEETLALRKMLDTRQRALPEELRSDKERAKEDYTQSLYRALTSGGLELMSKHDPGAGGMLGQAAAAAQRADVVGTMGEAYTTKTDKIEALEKRKDDLELKYAEVSAQLADAPKEKKFAYEKALADLQVELADSRAELASAIAEAGTIDLIGTAAKPIELLATVIDKTGFGSTKVHPDAKGKFLQAAEWRKDDYAQAIGPGGTYDRSEEAREMQRVMSDAMEKIITFAGANNLGNLTKTLQALTAKNIYDLGTVDNLTVKEILSDNIIEGAAKSETGGSDQAGDGEAAAKVVDPLTELPDFLAQPPGSR